MAACITCFEQGLAGAMRVWRLLGLTLMTTGATACDPIAGIAVRQQFSPAPTPDCVRSAIVALPFVHTATPQDMFDPRTRGYAFSIALRDSLGPTKRPMPPRLEMIARAPDTLELELNIHYFGEATWHLDSSAVARLVDIARPVTRAIHDACAPSSPAAPVCRVGGMGRSRPCVPAL